MDIVMGTGDEALDMDNNMQNVYGSWREGHRRWSEEGDDLEPPPPVLTPRENIELLLNVFPEDGMRQPPRAAGAAGATGTAGTDGSAGSTTSRPFNPSTIIYKELPSWTEECVPLLAATRMVLVEQPGGVGWTEEALVECGASHLLDNSSRVLLRKAARVCDPAYLPSNEDILQFAYPTNDTQRVDFAFPQKKVVLEMVDVGGQRNQRSRWKALSKECEAVIFVSSLDDYHQQLDEDATKNRLRESLRAFRVSRGLVAKYMPHAHTLLFLNKTDLFEQSLKRLPFENFFPEFAGKLKSGGSMMSGMPKGMPVPLGIQVANISHIVAGMFRDIHHDMRVGAEQEFACQFTSAIDTNHMKNIFEIVVSLITQANLKKQGFMA